MDKRIQSNKTGSNENVEQSKSRRLPPVRGEKPTNSKADGTSKQSKPSPSSKEPKARKISTLAPVDKIVVNKGAANPAEKGVGFSDSIGGYDFRAWERYDVDKVLEEMDQDEVMTEEEKHRRLGQAKDAQKQREAHRKMRLARDRENLSNDFLEALDDMSQEEREFMATRERQKGNECFKAGELDEAVVNYTRSAALNPYNAPVHANRSLAYLRLKMFERAEDDCTHALEVDPDYVKAWSRRGMVRHRRGKYAEAMTDFEMALKLEPSNVEVSKLLTKSKAKFEELEGVDSKAGTSFTRVRIEEVDSDNDDDDDGNNTKQPESSEDGFRKIAIVMDDDDSDEESDDDENENENVAIQPTKVPVKCDDDDDNSDEKNYLSVPIIDIEGDDDEDDNEEEADMQLDDDGEDADSQFVKIPIVCDVDDNENDPDESTKESIQYAKVPIVCDDDDENDSAQEINQFVKVPIMCDDDDDDEDDSAQEIKQFVKVPIMCDDDDDDDEEDGAQKNAFVKVAIVNDDDDSDADDAEGNKAPDKPLMENNFVKVQIVCDDDDNDDDKKDDDKELSSSTPHEYKIQGTKLFAQGDFHGASSQFSKAIETLQSSGSDLSKEQVSDLVSCSNNRAACALKLEKYEDARHDCDRVLKYDPQNHKAFLRRGTTCEKMGQLKTALQDFESALTISPGLKEAMLAVERISSQLQKPTASAVAEAITYKDMGNEAFKQKRLNVALGHYSRSVSLNPQLFVSYCNRALIFIKLGQFSEAVADCDKTLELNEGNEKALYRRGLALFEMNQYKHALEMFEKLLHISPDNQQAVVQVKKVKAILSTMPATKISVVQDNVKVPSISTTVTSSKDTVDDVSSSSTSPKKALSSPLKPVDTTHVAEAARERIKTKLTKGKGMVPKTAYEFENYWRTLKTDDKSFYNYFKRMKPRQIPKLFKGSINEDVLSSILVVIEKFMISEDCTRAYDTMTQIAKINRISTVLLLMGKDDKAIASTICNRLKAEGQGLDESGLQSLAKAFEVELD